MFNWIVSDTLQYLKPFKFVVKTELFKIELFLTFKLCTYSKLNCLKQNCLYVKIDLTLNNLQWLICHQIQPTNQPTNKTNKQTNTLTNQPNIGLRYSEKEIASRIIVVLVAAKFEINLEFFQRFNGSYWLRIVIHVVYINLTPKTRICSHKTLTYSNKNATSLGQR